MESKESQFRLSWRSWVFASLIAGSGLAFIAAFKLTYVANVTVIVAAVPFVTAFIEWAFLRQRVPNATLIAAALCVVGILVMVGGSFGSINLFGDTLAVVMIILQTTAMVLVRVFKKTPLFFPSQLAVFRFVPSA